MSKYQRGGFRFARGAQCCSMNTFPLTCCSHGCVVSLTLNVTRIPAIYGLVATTRRGIKYRRPVVWDLRMLIIAWLEDSAHNGCTICIDQLVTYSRPCAKKLGTLPKVPAVLKLQANIYPLKPMVSHSLVWVVWVFSLPVRFSERLE